MRFSFKALFISFSLLFFAGALFFGESLLSRFVEFSLRNFCKETLSAILKEESVTHKERVIVFENPSLIGLKGEQHAVAEQLILYYEPRFLNREMDLYITLVHPKIELTLLSPILATLFETEQADPFFRVHTAVQIKQGLLKLGKDEEIYYSLDHDFIKDKELNLKAHFGVLGDEKNSLNLRLFQNHAKKQVLHASLKDLCCKTLGKLLAAADHSFREFDVMQGVLNGDAGLLFGQTDLQTVSDIVAKDLFFTYKPLSIHASIPTAHFRFSEKNRGEIEFKKACLSFKPEVSIGCLKYNQLIGNGSLTFNLTDSKQLMSLQFKGAQEHLISFFPDVQKQYVEHRFKQGDFLLKGNLKKLIDANTLDEFFSFEGALDLIADASSEQESLLFGFELEEQKTLTREKLALQNGWFRTYHFNLEKYIAPFIFQDNQIKLSGYGDFEGSFDQEGIYVTHHARQVALENSEFLIEVDQILGGEYSYLFKEGKSFGKIPVSNGTYFEKNHGLYFTDIKADFEIEPTLIKAPFIEAYCNGAYFSGSQELDLRCENRGTFDVNFHLTELRAKISQAKTLFSHFNPASPLLKMPIDADLYLRQEGAFLNFQFKPDDYSFFASIQGAILNGAILSEEHELRLQDLELKFDYDHAAKEMSFSDIQGALFIGKPELAEEYPFAGDYLRFTNTIKREAEFDFWIGEKEAEVLRLAGKTKEQEQKELLDVALDLNLSHFGAMHFKTFQGIFKEGFLIDTLRATCSFELEPLLNDLKRFKRTGFFVFSRGLLKELDKIEKASGNFTFSLEFDKSKAAFNYDVEGKDFFLQPYHFSTASLKGKKAGPIWSIEELKLDKLSLAADILHHEEMWKINFLGAKLGSSLLVGLDGHYEPKSHSILATINFCEGHLENLKEFAFCKDTIEKFGLKGDMKAKGELTLTFGEEKGGFNADVLLNASLRECRLKNIHFQDAETLSCHYVMDKGVILRGIKTKALDGASEMAHLDIEKMEYGFKDHSFSLEGVHFKLPADRLGLLTDSLKSTFSEELGETTLSLLKDSKERGFLEGSFNLEILKPFYALHLSLKDDFYRVFGKEHLLQNFALDFDPCEFNLKTKYGEDKHPFWLNVHSKSKTLEFGRLLLMDEKEAASPLTIYWRNYPGKELAIETVEGSFCGIDAHLFRNPEKPLETSKFHLTGDVSLDFTKLGKLLDPPFGDKVKSWQIGSGFSLKGDWSLFNGATFNFLDSSFHGELIGTDFTLRGYQFQGLLAKVDYKLGHVAISDFHMEDAGGQLHADKLNLTKEREGWKLAIPLLKGQEIRPSLIRKEATFTPLSKKPLVISQLELQDVEGDLEDFNSLIGHGRLFFKNPHKKNLQNTILAIPAEIISRIGLDLTVLTPVIGTVEYQILDGKVLLNKFRDVYSEGKLSKFYLADSSFPSYIDFDGNLSIKVRMKHYNLLFKLAEMFVVNVQGNLRKPTYTFHKQQKQNQELLFPAEAI